VAAARKTQVETNASVLEKAIVRRLRGGGAGSGQVVWPAVPSLVDHYVRNLGAIFNALGRTFSEAELAHVKELMLKHIDLGFAASPFSKLVVDYHTSRLRARR